MRLIYNYYWILIAWVILVAAIAPWGDFPINDDWAYAQGVKNLLNGNWEYSDWQGMPFFSQMWWGWIWCKVFGFSHTILRISTIALGAFGIYFLLKSLRLLTSYENAFWLTCLLVFNPVYVHLSTSFMTDIPALTMSLAGFYYLLRFKLNNYWRFLIPAVFFIAAGTLIRQFTLLVPLGFMVEAAFKFRHNFLKIFGHLIVLIIGYSALRIHDAAVLNFQGDYPANYGFQFNTIKTLWSHFNLAALNRAGYYGYNGLIFIGLALTPLTLNRLKMWPGGFKGRKFIAFSVLLILGGIKVYITGNFWPFTADIVYPVGIGTYLLDGYASYELPTNTIVPAVLGTLTTLLAAYSLANLTSAINRIKADLRIAPLTIAILAILPILVMYVSDRYMLFAFAFVLLSVSSIYLWKVNKILVGVLIIGSFAFCRSHFNFQNTRYALIRTAEDLGGTPQTINGGTGYNAMYNFDIAKYGGSSKNWWAIHDKYVVRRTKNKDGYSQLQSKTYFNWVYLRNEKLYLLQRENLPK